MRLGLAELLVGPLKRLVVRTYVSTHENTHESKRAAPFARLFYRHGQTGSTLRPHILPIRLEKCAADVDLLSRSKSAANVVYEAATQTVDMLWVTYNEKLCIPRCIRCYGILGEYWRSQIQRAKVAR